MIHYWWLTSMMTDTCCSNIINWKCNWRWFNWSCIKWWNQARFTSSKWCSRHPKTNNQYPLYRWPRICTKIPHFSSKFLACTYQSSRISTSLIFIKSGSPMSTESCSADLDAKRKLPTCVGIWILKWHKNIGIRDDFSLHYDNQTETDWTPINSSTFGVTK